MVPPPILIAQPTIDNLMTEGSTEQTPLESLKTRPTTHIIDEISDTPKSTTTENTILIYIPLISLSLPIKSLPAAVSLI